TLPRTDRGVSGEAQPEPPPRWPPQQDGGPDQLGPGDDEEEDAVRYVLAEVRERYGEMDRSGAGGQGGQAPEDIWPRRGGRWAYLFFRQNRSAHTAHARLGRRARASGRGVIPDRPVGRKDSGRCYPRSSPHG